MITRTHTKGDTSSTAVYSGCERYRYSLTRLWDISQRRVVFIMLNPSTATEVQNDPTIERCEQRARRIGFGGFRAVNIFALRATDPRDMRADHAPEGSDNLGVILDAARWGDVVIAAWGVHGAHLGQGPRIAAALRKEQIDLFHLGLTKAGHPRHPLYLPYSAQPIRWAEPSA